jgi:hypothetical protein
MKLGIYLLVTIHLQAGELDLAMDFDKIMPLYKNFEAPTETERSLACTPVDLFNIIQYVILLVIFLYWVNVLFIHIKLLFYSCITQPPHEPKYFKEIKLEKPVM